MSLDWLDGELAALQAANLVRDRIVRQSSIGSQITVDGKTYLNFASNDYLGLAGDPSFAAQINETLSRFGWGSGASPLVVGRHKIHAQLESELAEFLEAEAAILFPSGFAANAGTIPAIATKGDLIFSDAKNHASIIDGCRLSGARVVIYRHSDLDDLSTKLNTEQADSMGNEKKLIVTDSLFSMDGDFAKLDRLVDLAEKHDAMLMVDEAHALGVVGHDGGGVCELHGVAKRVPIRVGTLSKAFGSHGGFVAGSEKLISFLAHRARSYVFSTAAPIAASVVALAGLEILRNEPARRRTVLSHADRIRQTLGEKGWQLSSSPGSHIVAVVVGEAAAAVKLSTWFRAAGIWAACIRPPTVPLGESLLRISLSSSHTDEMIDQLLETFELARSANA